MRKIFLLLYAFPLLFNAQSSTVSEFKPPKITPSSPDVSALLKYSDIPVTDYNGTANFSINLWNLKEGDLNLPISISYYSNGLKVDEESSSIGLGWSLLAGGVINEFHDLDHQNASFKIIPHGTNPNVSPDDESYYETNQIENRFESGCSYPDLSGTPITIADNQTLKYNGYKHTYYIYNFAGYTGKIIKDTEGNFISTNKSNIKFESIENGFKVTSSDGTVYLFQDIGNTSTVRNTSSIPCQPINNSITETQNAYYLTKIIAKTGQKINFVYETNFIETLPQISEWYTTFNQLTSAPHRVNAITSDIKEKILKEINTDDIKIKFYNSAREDILNGKKINKIEIYSVTNLSKPIKTIDLSFDYFQGDSSFGDFITQPRFGCSFINDNTTLDTRSKRLKLNSIIFKDSELQSVENYTFNYTTNSLPYKTSRARDMWGYFNGVNNLSLIPDVNNLGYYDYSIPQYFFGNPIPVTGSHDRKSNEDYMKWGMLKSISQPTKGISLMEYEMNEFTNYGTTTAITDKEISVQDLAAGKSQKTFEMAVDGYVTINAQISCSSPGKKCTDINDTCPSYIHQGEANINYDNRLYAIIEKKNSDGVWVLADDAYDRFNNQMQNNTSCAIQKQLFLSKGEYRITANYPDDRTGILGGPWAFLSVIYKYYSSTSSNSSKGAGLRIKSIKDYDTNNKISKEKNYTYNGGKLMNKPIFTYLFNDGSRASQFSASRTDGSYLHCNNYGVNEILPIPEYRTIYSNPIIGLSNNALGSYVGYDEVVVSNDLANEAGREINRYYNDYPGIFYTSAITGITPTDKLKNGLLKEKIWQKAIGTDSYIDLKNEKNDFKVNDLKVYWDFIPDNKPKVTNEYERPFATERGFLDTFMNFVPIQVAKTFLKEKTVKEYFYNDSNVLTGTIENQIKYEYNSKHQLINEKIESNDGKVIENKTYFPEDLKNSSRSSEMESLITLNQIDFPVQQEKYVDNIKILNRETKFIKDETTGNNLLPKEIYDWGINSSVNENRKLTFDKYDADGNVLQYSFNQGSPVTIIWGYNNSMPIAKIEGATYADIPQNLINDIVNASKNDIETTSEDAFESVLDSFRISLPNYLITTYVYDPQIGLKNITDPNGIKTFYKYDFSGRLKEVLDTNQNLVKEYAYNYSDKIVPNTIYFNEEQSRVFFKNDCTTGNIGGSYVYTIQPGKYISFTSVSDANQLAQNDINSNGQNIANDKGHCLSSCPFTLSPSIITSSLTTSAGKDNNNHVTLYIELSATNTIYWNQAVVLGMIGSDCISVNNQIIKYNEKNSDRSWTFIITPVGRIVAQLNSGTLSYPIVLNIEYNK